MADECPWPVEEFSLEETLLRRILAFNRETKRDHKFPGPDHFALREDQGETSLSFNWEKYADAETCYIVLGLTKGHDGSFIDPSGYVFFRYPIEEIVFLPKFESLEHDPSWNGNPSPEGLPNDRSHTLLYCGNFDNGTRALLSLYCQEKLDSQVKVKFKMVREEIAQLRLRINQTPFHSDWNFEGS